MCHACISGATCRHFFMFHDCIPGVAYIHFCMCHVCILGATCRHFCMCHKCNSRAACRHIFMHHACISGAICIHFFICYATCASQDPHVDTFSCVISLVHILHQIHTNIYIFNDIFTKTFTDKNFHLLCNRLGVKDTTP
jgi:hypothetical protein